MAKKSKPHWATLSFFRLQESMIFSAFIHHSNGVFTQSNESTFIILDNPYGGLNSIVKNWIQLELFMHFFVTLEYNLTLLTLSSLEVVKGMIFRNRSCFIFWGREETIVHFFRVILHTPLFSIHSTDRKQQYLFPFLLSSILFFTHMLPIFTKTKVYNGLYQVSHFFR